MPTTSTKIYSKNWEKNDMKLTKDEAKLLIESYRGKTKNDAWIDHCICVGDTAGRIAKALNKIGRKNNKFMRFNVHPKIKDLHY